MPEGLLMFACAIADIIEEFGPAPHSHSFLPGNEHDSSTPTSAITERTKVRSVRTESGENNGTVHAMNGDGLKDGKEESGTYQVEAVVFGDVTYGAWFVFFFLSFFFLGAKDHVLSCFILFILSIGIHNTTLLSFV